MLRLSGGDIALSRKEYGSPRSRARICRMSSSRERRSISGTVWADSWRGCDGEGGGREGENCIESEGIEVEKTRRKQKGGIEETKRREGEITMRKQRGDEEGFVPSNRIPHRTHKKRTKNIKKYSK